MEKNQTGWLERKKEKKTELCSGVYAIMVNTESIRYAYKKEEINV